MMGPENSGQFLDFLPVILVILGLGIVSIVGWLVWVFTRPGGRRSAGGTAGSRSEASPAPVAGESAVRHDQPTSPPYVLAISRGTEGWDIYVHGQRYASLDAVPDPGTQAEVVDAIRNLARFAQDYIQRQRGESRASGKQTPISSTPVPAPRTTREPPVAAPTRADLSALDASGRRTAPSSALTPSINLAQEIGDIVKEMLAATPSLQGHAVTLSSAAGGGVMFMVDGKVYHDIDSIPNPEIQALIRRATREWERR
jgi:hypothetical protein